jgi:hypothetical protein
MRSALVVCFVLALPGCGPRSYEEPRPVAAVLRGRVVDEAGDPLSSAVVQLDESGGSRAVTDDQGDFVIRDVRPGTHRIMALTLGFHPSVREVVVSQDTVHVTLELVEAPGAIAGGDLPLPGPHLLDQALVLLPRVLAESEIVALIGSFGLPEAGVTVWVPWSPPATLPLATL